MLFILKIFVIKILIEQILMGFQILHKILFLKTILFKFKFCFILFK